MEEQFQEPQDVAEPLQKPQKGRGAMKWLILALLVISATLLALAIVLSPQSSVDDGVGGESDVDSVPEESFDVSAGLTKKHLNASVSGMQVNYTITAGRTDVSEIESVWAELDDTGCSVYIEESHLTDAVSPSVKILAGLADCYGRQHLGFPTDNLDNDTDFINGWVRLYGERCGNALEPLGLPFVDGQCEVPMFDDVL